MRKKAGFTLIELLVVVSIISLLSSIVFSSLNSSRGKAKDSAIVQQVKQLQIVAEQVYDTYGSYALIQPYAWAPVGSCSTIISASNYSASAIEMCRRITSINGNDPNNTVRGSGYEFFIGNSTPTTKYSIMAWLPGKRVFYCLGSSGSSETTNGGWVTTGCAANP